MTIVRSVILTLSVCSSLSAQAVGVGFEVARSDHLDMRDARGLGLRMRFRIPIDLRFDYLAARGQRFDFPCGGLIPPGCIRETINYSADLHSFFVAARARLLSRGSFDLFAIPEVGVTSGTYAKRSATGPRRISGGGSNLGAGAALELSATRVGGTAIGGWIAARYRRFVTPGSSAVDGHEPHRQLNWISSVELGVTFALQPR